MSCPVFDQQKWRRTYIGSDLQINVGIIIYIYIYLRCMEERNQGYALLMTANKSLYRAPTFSFPLASHGGFIHTVRLEKLFPFCYRCTFLKRCDRLRSVPFYYRSPFRVITVLRFVSFLLLAFKRYSLASVFLITCTT